MKKKIKKRTSKEQISKKKKEKIKEYQKNYCKAKKNQKKNFFFSLQGIKMEQKALIFGKQCINKNTFHKNKTLVFKSMLLIQKHSFVEKRFIQ